MVEDEKEIQNFVDEVLRKEDDSAVPDNEYFKGFWVFALWGYIFLRQDTKSSNVP